MNIHPSLAHVSDRDLLVELQRLASRERHAGAVLVAHLAEVDARKLYLGEGFSCLFNYLTEALHFAEHAAYNRIEAARAARRFPVILDMLADGSVHLTAVRLLAPHLTAENHLALLGAARHKSRREVEKIVAGLCPQPDVPASIRKLPAKPSPPAPPPAQPQPAAALPVTPPAPLPQARPAVVAPLSAETYKIQFTMSEETREKLRLAQDMLRHQIPSGDVAAVMDRALTVLLEDLARKKFANTDEPRAGRATAPDSRHVPAAVKRQVWLRDLGRCAFVGREGHRCAERGFLEFHHVVPYAAGGPATADNIRLVCRRHNAYEAGLAFGPLRIGEAQSQYHRTTLSNLARAKLTGCDLISPTSPG